MNVLYDGWPLIYQPGSPAALHLMALLARRPTGVQASVALPGALPDWLPEGASPLVHRASNASGARLHWEQMILPRLARKIEADLLHLTMPGLALFGKGQSVLSPSGLWEGPGSNASQGEASASGELTGNGEALTLSERLRRSLGQGGLARARGLFWPADLPLPGGSLAPVPLFRLPPAVHPGFEPPALFAAEDLSALDLPETYVLYHGPCGLPALQRLLNAWSWAAGAIGEAFPLVLIGFEQATRLRIQALLTPETLEKTVRILPPVPFPWLAEIYRGCAALFHPAPISPWGSPVRHALACERPVVAAENPLIDAMTGPAAYLAPADDPRALGAAIITVVVEEEVSQNLTQAAHRRASAWGSETFSQALQEAYQAIISTS
jgi:hypothetical protein